MGQGFEAGDSAAFDQHGVVAVDGSKSANDLVEVLHWFRPIGGFLVGDELYAKFEAQVGDSFMVFVVAVAKFGHHSEHRMLVGCVYLDQGSQCGLG